MASRAPGGTGDTACSLLLLPRVVTVEPSPTRPGQEALRFSVNTQRRNLLGT